MRNQERRCQFRIAPSPTWGRRIAYLMTTRMSAHSLVRGRGGCVDLHTHRSARSDRRALCGMGATLTAVCPSAAQIWRRVAGDPGLPRWRDTDGPRAGGRRHHLAESTRRQYRQRMECQLDAVMALAPTQRDGRRLRKRYGKLRGHLFTFLDHPEVAPDKNSSERELRPTATLQGHWWLPLRMGQRPVRWLPLHRRHRSTARDRRLSGCPHDTVRPIRPRSGLSRYKPGQFQALTLTAW